MTDAEWQEFWSQSPSQAVMERAIRASARTTDAEERTRLITAWRKRNPKATCSDGVAWELARWEQWFGRRP